MLPFASGGHTLEVALGGDASGPLVVAVAQAPPWLVFDQTEAISETAEDQTEPIARLSFSVAHEAPVGAPAEVSLVVRNAAGSIVGSRTVRVEVAAPAVLTVERPRPNPSRGNTVIPYAVPEAGRVRMAVVDLLGREVLVLVDADEAAGGHEARVPSHRLASGVYVVRVVTGGEARAVRLTVVR